MTATYKLDDAFKEKMLDLTFHYPGPSLPLLNLAESFATIPQSTLAPSAGPAIKPQKPTL